MSTNDPHSDKPAGSPEVTPSNTPDKTSNTPDKKESPHTRAQTDEPIPISTRPRSSPAVRLATWILALVLLLAVLVWALRTS